MYSIAQTTYTLEKTCCVVTCTLDLTKPKMAWKISRTAPVWNIWRLSLVLA